MKLLLTLRLVKVFLFISIVASYNIQAQLTPGDIMFVAFEFDGDGTPDNPFNCGDGFAFVTLNNIPDGTEIIFTEEDYHDGEFGNGEGDLIWTNDTGGPIPIGCVVEITTNRENCTICNTLESSVGSAEFAGSYGDWILTASNEEMYAYIGDVRDPVMWLAGLTTNNAAIRAGTNTPPEELASLMIDLTDVDIHADVAVYSGDTGCPDKKACLDLILDVESNWSAEDGVEHDCCDGELVAYPEDIPGKFGSIMPVRLISFKAAAREKNIMLKWQTGSEINNDGFEVQRSRDGQTWSSIHFVKGNGNSNRQHSYEYIDKTAPRGLSFYRLKQMDYNGAYSFSSVVNARIKSSQPGLVISPNPFTDRIQIAGIGGKMTVYSQSGQLLQSITLNNDQYTYDLSSLLPGVYFVEIEDETGVIQKTRLVKE